MALHHHRFVLLLLLACCMLSVSRTTAHSWLECTDYRMDPKSADAKTWNPSVCHGRARCGGTQMNATFGQDTGFNEHSAKCQCARDSPKNTAPVAQYSPGQRVCLAYPPKNHVAAPCTNEYIPDAGVRITRSAVNPTSDDSIGVEYKQGNGEHKFGQIDYKGFQNCPNFCDNKEGALCTMCFDLESDLAPGSYTFKWIWAFNDVNDVYTTCWEATVGGSGSGGASTSLATASVDESPTTTVPSTSAPPSGGSDSTPSITPTVTATAVPFTDVSVAADEDCDDDLEMPDDDCDEELDLAGADEIGGEADLSLPSGSHESEDAYDAANPSDLSTRDTPAPGGNQEQRGNGNGYGGGGASESTKPRPEAAVGSPIHSPSQSQHGYHHKWHRFGRGNGRRHRQQKPNGKPGRNQQQPNSDNYGGDDEEDPDCALPIANTKAPDSAPTATTSEAGQEGESANASIVDGGAPSEPTTPATDSVEPDCEDELRMPDASIEPSGKHEQGDPHAHPGDSYSFGSGAQPVSGETSENVAGNVLPYPDEY